MRINSRSAPLVDLLRVPALSVQAPFPLPSAPGKARDNRREFSGFDWFRHMHLEAGRQRADAINRTAIGGQRDTSNSPTHFRRQLSHLSHQFIAIDVRHADVGYQNIRSSPVLAGREHGKSLLSG